MARTLKDKFRLSLEKRGWSVETTHKRTLRLTLTHPKHDRKIFLGRSGSVRMGRTYTSSLPISDAAKDRLLKELETA